MRRTEVYRIGDSHGRATVEEAASILAPAKVAPSLGGATASRPDQRRLALLMVGPALRGATIGRATPGPDPSFAQKSRSYSYAPRPNRATRTSGGPSEIASRPSGSVSSLLGERPKRQRNRINRRSK